VIVSATDPAELAELAERYGTPLYVYDLDEVELAHRRLVACLPQPHRLLYSLKANPLPALAERLARLGCGAEVSSARELKVALAAGFPARDILFTGPAKRSVDLDLALAAGCRRYSIESTVDLERVRAAAARSGANAEGLLRINVDEALPGVPLAFGGRDSAFGTDMSRVLAEPHRFMSREHLRITGVHLYLAGNVADETVLATTLGWAARSAEVLTRYGFGWEVLDLGGGFGAPYAEVGPPYGFGGLSAALGPTLDQAVPGWRHGAPDVWFESGRYLVGGAGTLIVRVADVKESGGERYVVVQSGVHHLGGMAGLRRLPTLQVQPLDALDRRGSGRSSRVVGELCTPLDRWASRVVLPESLGPGDLVMVPNVGAYGLTASLLGFLSHPAPVEVVRERREVVSVTQLELRRRSVLIE
jgi:diaminopimelate decarboxylase